MRGLLTGATADTFVPDQFTSREDHQGESVPPARPTGQGQQEYLPGEEPDGRGAPDSSFGPQP